VSWLRILAALCVLATPVVGGGALPTVDVEENDAGETIDANTLVRHALAGQRPPVQPAARREVSRRQRHDPQRHALRRAASATGRPLRARPRLVRRSTPAVDDDAANDDDDDTARS
jgi:hypothetical protein